MKKKSAKKKLKSLAKLKKELWKVFTVFIKNRDGWKCFTCDRKCSGSGAHGGHFINKSVGGIFLYFDEDNVHCQCYNCNINLGGNQYEYGMRLGEMTVALLQEKRKKYKGAQWDRMIFDEKIAYYTAKTST